MFTCHLNFMATTSFCSKMSDVGIEVLKRPSPTQHCHPNPMNGPMFFGAFTTFTRPYRAPISGESMGMYGKPTLTIWIEAVFWDKFYVLSTQEIFLYISPCIRILNGYDYYTLIFRSLYVWNQAWLSLLEMLACLGANGSKYKRDWKIRVSIVVFNSS